MPGSESARSRLLIAFDEGDVGVAWLRSGSI